MKEMRHFYYLVSSNYGYESSGFRSESSGFESESKVKKVESFYSRKVTAKGLKLFWQDFVE